MNRRHALLLAAALIAVVLASLAVRWLRLSPAVDDTVRVGSAETVPATMSSAAALYFPATSGWLEPEMRTLPTDLDPDARERWLAEQLLAGPESEGLQAALPDGTRVASVFAAPDGTVFVDLKISETLGMGSTEEMLSIYSIVNTMLLNDEAAQRVVILINGRQHDSLAGHVDTSSPLTPRPDLIREAG